MFSEITLSPPPLSILLLLLSFVLLSFSPLFFFFVGHTEPVQQVAAAWLSQRLLGRGAVHMPVVISLPPEESDPAAHPRCTVWLATVPAEQPDPHEATSRALLSVVTMPLCTPADAAALGDPYALWFSMPFGNPVRKLTDGRRSLCAQNACLLNRAVLNSPLPASYLTALRELAPAWFVFCRCMLNIFCSPSPFFILLLVPFLLFVGSVLMRWLADFETYNSCSRQMRQAFQLEGPLAAQLSSFYPARGLMVRLHRMLTRIQAALAAVQARSLRQLLDIVLPSVGALYGGDMTWDQIVEASVPSTVSESLAMMGGGGGGESNQKINR